MTKKGIEDNHIPNEDILEAVLNFSKKFFLA